MMAEKNENSPLNALIFFTQVDWTEPWLIGLVAFHILITTLTLITRHKGNLQGGLFFILLILVYNSEHLNEMAAQNWKSFSRYQYFDSNGMFISTVFSAPLLLNCIVMVGQWMWTSGTLMIHLKQKELRQHLNSTARQRTQSQRSEKDSSSSTQKTSLKEEKMD